MNTLAIAVFACLAVFVSAKPSGLWLAEDDGQWRGEGLLESQWRGEGLLESQDLEKIRVIAGPGLIAPGLVAAPGLIRAAVAPGWAAPGLVGPIAPAVGLVRPSAGAVVVGPSGIVGGPLLKKW